MASEPRLIFKMSNIFCFFKSLRCFSLSSNERLLFLNSLFQTINASWVISFLYALAKNSSSSSAMHEYFFLIKSRSIMVNKTGRIKKVQIFSAILKIAYRPGYINFNLNKPNFSYLLLPKSNAHAKNFLTEFLTALFNYCFFTNSP